VDDPASFRFQGTGAKPRQNSSNLELVLIGIRFEVDADGIKLKQDRRSFVEECSEFRLCGRL